MKWVFAALFTTLAHAQLVRHALVVEDELTIPALTEKIYFTGGDVFFSDRMASFFPSAIACVAQLRRFSWEETRLVKGSIYRTHTMEDRRPGGFHISLRSITFADGPIHTMECATNMRLNQRSLNTRAATNAQINRALPDSLSFGPLR